MSDQPSPEVPVFGVEVTRIKTEQGDFLSLMSVLNFLLQAADAFAASKRQREAAALKFVAEMLASGTPTQGVIPPR